MATDKTEEKQILQEKPVTTKKTELPEEFLSRMEKETGIEITASIRNLFLSKINSKSNYTDTWNEIWSVRGKGK